ncbi:MAG TPA: penicillin-binding protein [Moheibacter sp.]|nr:penicillin-binding protein [Moheibacter sp.]
MIKIQVAEGQQLDDFAERNFDLVEEPAERGNLYASEGALLATTVTVHDVFIDLLVIKDDLFESEVGALSDSLSRMFQKPASYFETKLRNERKNKNRYMTLIKGLDYQDYMRIKSFPIFKEGQNKGGFIHETRPKRELVLSDVGARTIGYDDHRGKVGLEGAYSNYLSGTVGKRWVQFMGRGQWKPFKSWEQEPVNGSNVYTTIDAGMQIAAYSALQDQLIKYNAEHGCVAVMEVETGKIRAIVNLKRIADSVYSDVLNYVVGEGAEPGSTFKTVSILAGLENEKFTPETTVETGNGSYRLYNRRIHDTHGYGTIDVGTVLVKSSNIGTAKLINAGYGSDPQEYFDQLDKWHLTKPLGIDIQGEAAPQFHRPEDPDWSNVTLPVMSYGYGFKLTPLQILTFYNGIANGGKLLKPLFIDKIEKHNGEVKEYKPRVLVEQMSSPQNIKAITEMLKDAVSDGTARNIFTEHYEIAGKTGTARVEYWIKNQPMQYRASFAGFFPADNPKYTCVVIIHKPDRRKGYYGGGVTAPVFKKIADWVYSRTPRSTPELPKMVNVNKALTTPDFKVNYETRKVPNLIGKSGESVVPALENLGLDVRYTGIGKVLNQSIPAGTAIRKGETIYLVLEG